MTWVLQPAGENKVYAFCLIGLIRKCKFFFFYIPGPNQKGTVVAVQSREDKIKATGASELGGRLSPPPGFCKKKQSITVCPHHPLNFWTFRHPCIKVDNEDFFFLCDFS